MLVKATKEDVEQDRYLQTNGFLINSNTEQALTDFMEYARVHFYKKQAADWMRKASPPHWILVFLVSVNMFYI